MYTYVHTFSCYIFRLNRGENAVVADNLYASAYF